MFKKNAVVRSSFRDTHLLFVGRMNTHFLFHESYFQSIPTPFSCVVLESDLPLRLEVIRQSRARSMKCTSEANGT